MLLGILPLVNSMKIKDDSVNLWGLQPEMQPVLKWAEGIWESFIHGDLVITSARDGIHSAGSLHYYGYAVDLRTWDSEGEQISMEIKQEMAKILRLHLAEYSSNYDVIIHSTHIHVEYDYIKAGLIK